MQQRRQHNPYFLLTDKELAAEAAKVRIALMFKRPVTAAHLRCLEEVARRLDALERVSSDDDGITAQPSNDNGVH